jgi:hypothetical protein
MSFAQKFETNITISQAVTSGSIEIPEGKIALGFSGAIQGLFNVSENIAIGTELNYSYQDYNLSKDFKGISIPESNSYYESGIILHTLNIPLILRYKTQKSWIVQVQLGLTYIIDSKTNVDYIYSDWTNETNTKTEITDKSDDLKKDFNSYINLGFGKKFKIFNIDASMQIFSEIAMQNYNFSHTGIQNEAIYDYKVQPFLTGLKFGIRL